MDMPMRVALTVALVFTGISLTGCGPSAEERTAMNQLNQFPELIEKGLYVKKLDRFESDEDKVFVVEAQVVNAEGVAVGILRSERVEGFGTSKPRILMYKTPGVAEEWDWDKYWEQNGGRRRGRDRNRDNQTEEKKTDEN
jgi:hypothetical protein